MQITADLNEISKIVQPNLTFILYVVSEFCTHFSKFWIVLAEKFHINWILLKTRLRYYA